jgi:thiol:disulfide interchange protein DsbA
MKRREFTLALGAASLLPRLVQAATELAEGRNFKAVQPPVPVAVAGKIEVIEFFGYWCPHCNDFEPMLEAWVGKLPATVNFRRIPIAWQAAQVPYQKLYFALEALGQVEALHRKAFDAVHVQRLRFDSDAGIAAFATGNGLDRAKLVDTMNGFTVASKVRVANQAAAAYRIDGVPTLAVNGRFETSPDLAGGEERALQVVDALIVKSRAGR